MPDEEASVPMTPLQPAIPTTKPMTKSILLTIKKMLGIAEEYHAFDIDIIININSVFLTLNQLGVGPLIPYQIAGAEEVWQDFLGDQEEYLVGVQTYVYLKTRLLFDPPTNSFLVDSYQKQIQELEWRLNIQAESSRNQNGSNEAVEFVEMTNERVKEIYEAVKAGDISTLRRLFSNSSTVGTSDFSQMTPERVKEIYETVKNGDVSVINNLLPQAFKLTSLKARKASPRTFTEKSLKNIFS